MRTDFWAFFTPSPLFGARQDCVIFMFKGLDLQYISI